MLHVYPTKHHLPLFIQNHFKEKDYFLIKDNQLPFIEQIIDEMIFTIFTKTQSFVVIILKKFLMELINKKLSLSLLEEIFQLLKQQEADLKMYKQHFFQLESVMFQQEQLGQICSLNLQQKNENLLDCSIVNNKLEQALDVQEIYDQLGPSQDKNAKSLSFDIDCYSEDSKHNFVSFDDKYFCSEYLTTSQDEKQFTSRTTILKQLKQQMQNKLKIHPHVSAFNFSLHPNNIPIDIQQELLEWKRTKRSILQQPSLRKALSPNDLDQTMLIEKMKQNHYRQKIKSVIVRRRLSTKHLVS